MKQKDHKALAYYLIDRAGQGPLWRRTWHRRFFILGCVIPDYIPFTYLRGFWKSHAMQGHNACYSRAYIQRRMHSLQQRGVRSRRDCFALGKLMHYLADSFTFVHTEGFCGGMREHRRYERGLHEIFPQYVSCAMQKGKTRPVDSVQLSECLRQSRKEYECFDGGYERDCKQILGVCTEVFQILCANE